MIVRSTVALVSAALLAGVLVAAGGGTTRAAATGSPDRGRAVYFGPGGCSGCHSASADPAEPSTGPQLTLATLQAHAADAGKPLGAYVAESILVPGAYAAPGYVSGMMQPPRGLTPLQIEDLVSYLIGKPWTSPAARAAEAAGEADRGVRGEGVVPGHGRALGEGRAAARRGARRREDRRDLRLPLLPPLRGQRREERVGARADPRRPREGDSRRAREAAAVPDLRSGGIGDAVLRGARRRESAADRGVPARLARTRR